ncbi:hypothetical protein CCORG_1354 [Campylobacter corcagiensis]|nr:hypothetical protein CCORG_1354 [Campylobacter corcagiensis]
MRKNLKLSKIKKVRKKLKNMKNCIGTFCKRKIFKKLQANIDKLIKSKKLKSK